MRVVRLFLCILSWGGIATGSYAKIHDNQSVYTKDVKRCADWVSQQFETTGKIPFSFKYDQTQSADFLSDFQQKVETSKINENKLQEIRTYTKDGLEVRCEIIRYQDFPAVEWVVYLKNTGQEKSKTIADLLALNTSFGLNGKEDVYLNYHEGGHSGAKDFRPNREKIEKNTTKELGAFWGGFPTAETLPFFNVEWDAGTTGIISAVGWPAQWKATFERTDKNAFNIRVGQIKTSLYLEPGEEIRSPLVVLLFWHGTREQAQNTWRQWMFKHNLPRPGGKLPTPILEAASSSFFAEMFHATDKDQMEFISRYLEEGIQLDYWWMDAGWYPNKGGSWQDLLGTWYPDIKRYPNGLAAISDYAHARNVKTLLWFEPERVTAGSWIYENHPEWTLGSGTTRFFNYGHPEALTWMTNRVDSLLKSEKIDLYRQDFAVMASDYWNEEDRKNPDRQGMAEIKHVIGYLTYMDELQRRHPEMLFDICAAGGKRLELENLRRAVPLWRSDHAFDPIGVQGQTYGLSVWVPFSGAGVNKITEYDFRSNMSPSIVLNLDARIKEADYPLLRTLLKQWEEIRDDYYGDFYTLTSYSLEPDIWIGWEFFRPENGTGFFQLFNRPASIYDSGMCKLKGLNRGKQYRITDMDTGEHQFFNGTELSDKGCRITFTQAPQSKLFRIEEMKQE